MPFLPTLVEETMFVVAHLPTKLGIVFVHFLKALVLPVRVQKISTSSAEWHEMRFAVVPVAIVESYLPRADCAILWTAAMTPMVEPTRTIGRRFATNEAEVGATRAIDVVRATLATDSYSAPWA